ncbi:MAG: acyl carrier protein [Lachnospiraceae bacterium]|nr:acyl carrier protein [Lachnospiraceae bacterium]
MELEVLKTAISNILKVDPNEITEETTFLGDLGADSLDVYQIVSGVEEELNITITAEDVEKITNVGEAVEVIEKALKNV